MRRGRFLGRRARSHVWNGTSWSVSHSGSSYGELRGVSCTSPTFCLAVGGTFTAPGRKMFVERWDGNAWSMLATLQPPDPQEYVPDGIACASSTLCFVVGNRQGDGGVKPLLQKWNGTTWSSLDRGPDLAGLNGDLTGVTCSAPTSCVAVGYEYHGGDNATTVIVRWNGTSWAKVPSPSPSALNYLFNVTCTSASSCFAFGDQTPDLQHAYTSLILALERLGVGGCRRTRRPRRFLRAGQSFVRVRHQLLGRRHDTRQRDRHVQRVLRTMGRYELVERSDPDARGGWCVHVRSRNFVRVGYELPRGRDLPSR